MPMNTISSYHRHLRSTTAPIPRLPFRLDAGPILASPHTPSAHGRAAAGWIGPPRLTAASLQLTTQSCRHQL